MERGAYIPSYAALKGQVMRPYGLRTMQGPDVRDAKEMGMRGSLGPFPSIGGEFHGHCRGVAKAKTRRYWKRLARIEGKQLAQDFD